VRQNLSVFGRLYGVKNLAERIARLAADLDLKDFIDRQSGKLSAGQKTIMMKRGKIVDDDAPTRLLARYGRQNLEEVFLDVARGRGKASTEIAK